MNYSLHSLIEPLARRGGDEGIAWATHYARRELREVEQGPACLRGRKNEDPKSRLAIAIFFCQLGQFAELLDNSNNF